MWGKDFEGWYFKHQRDGDAIAFIPGRAKSGAFIQMIGCRGSRQFDVAELTIRENVIHAGGCCFSARGVAVDLPGVRGELRYGPLSPLRGDIMGPFRFLPMQCRHGVISMGHALSGSLEVDGRVISFDGGQGYMEKDSGTSFPRSYLWLQCNDFPRQCSLMLSIAHIPFAGLSFLGCICAILFEGREYRLATYRGVRILSAGPGRVCLAQGGLRLTVDVLSPGGGHSLRSPVKGVMSGLIRESNHAAIGVRLQNGGRTVFDLCSEHASFEWVGGGEPNGSSSAR